MEHGDWIYKGDTQGLYRCPGGGIKELFSAVVVIRSGDAAVRDGKA